MKVTSVVKMDFGRIKELTQAAVTALEMTAEAQHTEVIKAQVMPFDSGHLEEDATFVDYSESGSGKVSIVSSTPYARRLYFHPEYHFQKHENPDAGGEWFKDWISGGRYADFAVKTFKKFYKQIGGV